MTFYYSHLEDLPEGAHMALPLTALPAEPVGPSQAPINLNDFHGQDYILNQTESQHQIANPSESNIEKKIENKNDNISENKIENKSENKIEIKSENNRKS